MEYGQRSRVPNLDAIGSSLAAHKVSGRTTPYTYSRCVSRCLRDEAVYPNLTFPYKCKDLLNTPTQNCRQIQQGTVAEYLNLRSVETGYGSCRVGLECRSYCQPLHASAWHRRIPYSAGQTVLPLEAKPPFSLKQLRILYFRGTYE